jgi:hypothetical protein
LAQKPRRLEEEEEEDSGRSNWRDWKSCLRMGMSEEDEPSREREEEEEVGLSSRALAEDSMGEVGQEAAVFLRERAVETLGSLFLRGGMIP